MYTSASFGNKTKGSGKYALSDSIFYCAKCKVDIYDLLCINVNAETSTYGNHKRFFL